MKDVLTFLSTEIQLHSLWEWAPVAIERGIMLKASQLPLCFHWWFSSCWAKTAVWEGYRVAFRIPYYSTTSLQLPCSVTKRTVTHSQEPTPPGRLCTVCPSVQPPQQLWKGLAYPEGLCGCPGRLASKEKSQDPRWVHLPSAALFLPPTSGYLLISQIWELRKIWYADPQL